MANSRNKYEIDLANESIAITWHLNIDSMQSTLSHCKDVHVRRKLSIDLRMLLMS
jgi:hypothetical protein